MTHIVPAPTSTQHQMNGAALVQIASETAGIRGLAGRDDGFQTADEVRDVLEKSDLNSIVVIRAEKLALKCLPVELEKFSNLKELSLSSNALTFLPDQISRLKQLVIVRLSHNQLTSLPEGFGLLKRLEQVIIKGNLLRELPQNFGNLSHLQNCRLNRNLLASLPEGFSKLKRLEYFNICRNQLKSIPDNINDLSKLHYLDITGNPLESPPNIYNLAVNGALTILKADKSTLDLIPEDKREEILSAIDRRFTSEFLESNVD